METFEVTLLADDLESSWQIPAQDPDEALEIAIAASAGVGIYSVWDPLDPMGMPLVEREVDGA